MTDLQCGNNRWHGTLNCSSSSPIEPVSPPVLYIPTSPWIHKTEHKTHLSAYKAI